MTTHCDDETEMQETRDILAAVIRRKRCEQALRQHPELAARLRADVAALGLPGMCGDSRCKRHRRCANDLRCVVENGPLLRKTLAPLARRLGMDDPIALFEQPG